MEQINEFYKSLTGLDLTEQQINNWNDFVASEHYNHVASAYDNNILDIAFHFIIGRNSNPY